MARLTKSHDHAGQQQQAQPQLQPGGFGMPPGAGFGAPAAAPAGAGGMSLGTQEAPSGKLARKKVTVKRR